MAIIEQKEKFRKCAQKQDRKVDEEETRDRRRDKDSFLRLMRWSEDEELTRRNVVWQFDGLFQYIISFLDGALDGHVRLASAVIDARFQLLQVPGSMPTRNTAMASDRKRNGETKVFKENEYVRFLAQVELLLQYLDEPKLHLHVRIGSFLQAINK